MAEITGGGSTTSFTNTPQAKDDSYAYLEDLLRANSTLYDSLTGSIFLDVMANDLGGNAKSLFSVEDGDGNPITADYDLLAKDVNAAGLSPWESTFLGNWVRINNGKIEYRIADGSGIPGQGASVDSLSAGEILADQFVYAIRLGNGTLSEATVKINITGANDAATIAAIGPSDNMVTEAGGVANASPGDPAASGMLQVTDADAGESSFQVPAAAALAGTYGDFTFNAATGAWTYTLNDSLAATQALKQGQAVTETLVVTSLDGGTTFPITVTVNGTNDAPVAIADSAGATEDAAIINGSVAANDYDVDADAVLTFAATTPPAGFAMAADGSWSFDPSNAAYQHVAQGAAEQVIVNYTVTDEFGGSASSTLTITVTGANDGPVAVVDATSSTENQTVTIDVLANDTDVDDGHSFTLVSASAPVGKGSASVVGNQLQFDPGAAFDHLNVGDSEIVTVNYTMQDEHGASSSSTLSITITGTNDGPVAVADATSSTENQTVTIDVLANDTDVDDGHFLTLTSASAPAGKGSATVVGNQLQFDPGTAFDHLNVGDSEIVTVNYTMQDEHGASSSSTLTVTVTGTNDGPVANADLGATTENAAVTVDVLGNDTDADDGALLSLVSASAPAGKGSASVVSGQVQFDPGSDFDHLAAGITEDVVVDYTMQDEHGVTSSSTLTITVTGTNDAPVVTGAVTGLATEDGATSTLNALANASDVDDGALLSVVDVPAVLPAGVSYNAATSSFTLDPSHAAYQHLAAGATTVVSVDYGVSDGIATTPASMSWTVTGTNDAPTVAAAIADQSSSEDAAWNFTVPVGTFSDVDDGTLLSYTATLGDGSALPGWLTFDAATRTFSGTPPLDFNGAIDVKVTANDGSLSASDTFTLTVTPVNDPPALTGTQASLAAGTEDTAYIVAVADLIAGFTDVDGDALSVSGLTADHGLVTANLDGTYTITPDANYNGPVMLSYSVVDGNGGSVAATQSFSLAAVNDAAVITGAVSGAVTEDLAPGTVSGNLNSTDIDNPDDVWTAVAVPAASANGYGSYTIDASGQWTYTLDNGHPAVDALNVGDGLSDSFTVTTVDGTTQLVTVTIHGTNDAAVIAGDDEGEVTEATAANPGDPDDSGTLTAADVDNPANTFQAAAGGTAYGSYTINANGLWTYNLNNANPAVNALVAGAFLIDSFIIYSDDGTAHTVEVRINGADDAIVLPVTYTGGGDANDFDSLVGGAANNSATINGGNGNDVITGDGGNQTINGNNGSDTIYAQGGNDNVNGNALNDTLYGQAGNDIVDGSNGLDTIYGGSGDDQLTGGSDADVIYGGSGADSIIGNAGDDIIIGGFGSDTLTGSSGNDTFKYLSLLDTNDFILDFLSGTDEIDLSALDADGSTALNDTLGWGGTTPTANGIWYAQDGANTVVYADTDGNAGTAEFAITLQGYDSLLNPLQATDFVM